jgi:hypothetical protein
LYKKLALVLAALLCLMLVPVGSAGAATPATRAYIIASVGDGYKQATGTTNAEIDAAATFARTDLNSGSTFCDGDGPVFSDVDDVDLDQDGDTDDRDARIAQYIVILQCLGAIEGPGDGTFQPRDELARAQTATVYAATLGVDVRLSTNDVQYVDVTKASSPTPNVHGCNIHTLSDLDDDGNYVAASNAEPTPSNPYIIQGYEPRPGETHPDLFGPWDDVTQKQVNLMTGRSLDVVEFDDYDSLCRGQTYPSLIEALPDLVEEAA